MMPGIAKEVHYSVGISEECECGEKCIDETHPTVTHCCQPV